MIYEYKGLSYPQYLKEGNATQYITPFAKKFCKGNGIDIGCGDYPLEGSIPWDLKDGKSADTINGPFDYIYSSHCLEHISDYISTLEYWYSQCKVLFLYLPHPDMEYWLPQNNRKHLHSWYPEDMVKVLEDIGFKDVIHSERDLFWSYSVVGYVRLP